MERPKRLYCSLPDAAKSCDCTVDDLFHFAEAGRIKLSIKARMVNSDAFSVEDEDALAFFIVHAEGLFDVSQSAVINFLESPNEKKELTSVITNEFSKVFVSDDYDYVSEYLFSECGPIEVYLGTNPKDKKEQKATIGFDELMIRTKELDLFSHDKSDTQATYSSNLPKELECAFLTYGEFWENRPKNENPTREKDINKFITEKMGGNISSASLERIRTVSRPENEKSGGAPRSDLPTYKGKSKQNT